MRPTKYCGFGQCPRVDRSCLINQRDRHGSIHTSETNAMVTVTICRSLGQDAGSCFPEQCPFPMRQPICRSKGRPLRASPPYKPGNRPRSYLSRPRRRLSVVSRMGCSFCPSVDLWWLTSRRCCSEEHFRRRRESLPPNTRD